MATLLLSALPQEIAWRALFWVGLSPALLVFFVRQRFVEDPPVFEKRQKNLAATGETPSFLEIFSPAMLSTTILACLLTTGAQGGYYAITPWLPTFLQTERQCTVIGSGGCLAVVILGAFTGYLLSAWLNDRIVRHRNFILFAVCSILVVTAYTLVPVNDAARLVPGFPLGFFASGMGPVLTELFPTRMRGSGQGFAYNFGRGVAALNPWFVGLLSAILPLGQSMGIFAPIAYGLVVICSAVSPGNRRSRAGYRRQVTRNISLWQINSANLELTVRLAADRQRSTMIDFRSLGIFVWISKRETHSFQDAAVEWNITQPAIGARMKRLEQFLEVPLFERHGNKVTLTPKGRELLAYAERLIGLYEEMIEAIDLPPTRGLVRLGVSETINHTWLPTLFARVKAARPNLEFVLDVDTSPCLLDRLVARHLTWHSSFNPRPPKCAHSLAM
jgi:MFS family permease